MKVMIINKKTQEKLYTDVNRVMFTLEDKAGACSRMLDVIRDTSEYPQLISLLPSHILENPKDKWWQDKAANSLLSQLLQVIDNHTPEEYRFCPISGRTYGFAYAEINSGYEKDMLYTVEISLDQSPAHGKQKRPCEEIAELVTTDGYSSHMERKAVCRITKGKTRLSLYNRWIRGYCESDLLLPLIFLLLKGGRYFRFTSCKITDAMYGFSPEEETGYYHRQYRYSVHYLVFDIFRRKPAGSVADNLMEIAKSINIFTLHHSDNIDEKSPAYLYVREAYRKQVRKGYLQEYTRTWIREEIRCARPTKKGTSKNIFYGTEL